MSLRKLFGSVFRGSVLLVLVFVLIGAATGQPFVFSYVESGSMSPTMEPGDGFVAVPDQLAGSVTAGDVVVYQSEEVHDGDLTTHRVVESTDRGFVTKGDANPFTDQDAGEPPVKRAQVAATAMQVNGRVLVIPGLGTAVESVRSVLTAVQRHLAAAFGSTSLLGASGLGYLFFAATVLWYLAGELVDGASKRRERGRSRADGVPVRLVVGAFAAVLVLGATAAMVVPAGTQEYGIVSAEFESERSNVIPAGQSNSHGYPLENDGLLPVVTYLEPGSDGVSVGTREQLVSPLSTRRTTVVLHAPPETGYYRRYVTERRYLAILPRSHIRALYEIHPWAPIAVIDALLAVPFYGFGVRLAGRGRVRKRSRESPGSVVARIRGFVRNLY